MTKVFSPLFILLILTKSIDARAEKMDSLRMEQVNGKNVIIHRADAGQTLYSLLRRYGSSMNEFRQLNPDEDINLILGKVYRIPYGKKNTMAIKSQKNSSSIAYDKIGTQFSTSENEVKNSNNKPKSIIVQPGQYLYSISKKTGYSVEEIKRWNNLTSNELKVGQILYFGKVRTKNLATLEDIEKELLDDDPTPKKKSKEIIVYDQEGTDAEIAKKEAEIKRLREKKREEEIRLNDEAKENAIKVIAQKKDLEAKAADKVKKDSALKIDLDTKNKESDLRQAALEGVIKNEEGIAEVIDIESRKGKYLALHKTAPNGTLIHVTNQGNGAKAWVKVVGKIPENKENENVIIIMNQTVMEKLGATNTKRFRSHITYNL
jgi:LysM repeat protein